MAVSEIVPKHQHGSHLDRPIATFFEESLSTKKECGNIFWDKTHTIYKYTIYKQTIYVVYK